MKKNTLETILDKLDNEFTTEKFVMIASSQGIQEEVALNILENGSKELLLVRPGKYRKIT